jgi:hypothetical protein
MLSRITETKIGVENIWFPADQFSTDGIWSITLSIPGSRLTDGGMPETKAWRAPKIVDNIEIKVARLAVVTLLSLNVLLASADPSVSRAAGLVSVTPCNAAGAFLTAPNTEVVVVGLTPVTLLTRDSGMTLTLPLRVALETP